MVASSAMYFLRPKTILQEFDTTQVGGTPAGTTAFINSEFRKGSLDPQYVSGSIERFYQNYGDYSDPTLSFGHDTGVSFLASRGQLLVNRVVPTDTKYAALDVLIDVDTIYGNRMLVLPNNGVTTSYASPVSAPFVLKFSAQLITGNTFTMQISDGITVSGVSVVYATSHANTMANIVTAINTILSSYGIGGYVSIYTETSSVLAVSYTIIIRPPTNASLVMSSPLVSGGVSQASTSLANSGYMMTVYAENPGAWANDIGIKINQIDPGVSERYRLTFNSALITGNTFAATINGVATTPVVFTTSSDNTMTLIAAALEAHPNIRSAYVETAVGSVSNDRSIIIVAEVPGDGYLSIDSTVVTGGASQALISSVKTLTGKTSNGSFVIEVYRRAAPTLPMERFTVTSYSYRDGRGEQIKYTNIINTGSKKSGNIRVVMESSLETAVGFSTILSQMLAANFQFKSTVTYMGGGFDGSAVTSSQMVAALAKFEDRVHYPFNMILNAGYTSVQYQQACVNLAISRGDCTAILDMPTAYQGTAQVARDYRLYELNIDSSHGAIYTPDVMIADVTTGEHRYVPPSGMVGAAYVYNDAVGARWTAPAGLNRGKLRSALGLRVTYSPLDEELLHPNQVNAIVDRPAVGIVIMGEQTLQSFTSALSSIHIRRLMNDIETVITDQLDYTLFEPQSESTRYAVTQMADGVLSPIHRREGLYDYFIQCDDVNNTPEVIDADSLALDIYVKPVRAIKGILMRAIIARTGVSFEILSAQFNNTQAA
jgi:hypothetical protein